MSYRNLFILGHIGGVINMFAAFLNIYEGQYIWAAFSLAVTALLAHSLTFEMFKRKKGDYRE